MHILLLVTGGMEENGCRNYFMINLYESMGQGWDRIATPGSAIRHISAAKHVTDLARCFETLKRFLCASVINRLINEVKIKFL